MTNDEKLIEDIKALLRAAGYEHLTSSTSSHGMVLSGDKASAGAVVYLTPQRLTKAAARQGAAGGPQSGDDKPDVAVSPSLVDMHKQMTTDPAVAARLLGTSPEIVRHALTIQPNP
jgi:hypothetical protein